MNLLVTFDLDDTLFDEVEFVRSAHREIARTISKRAAKLSAETIYEALSEGGFDRLIELPGGAEASKSIGVDIPSLVDMYRRHRPDKLPLREGAAELLEWVKDQYDCTLGLITDGRSGTQRAKLQALGIEKLFPQQNILISEETGVEKTSPIPFITLMGRNPHCTHYLYIGDNPAKDFINPGKSGWDTVCMLDAGNNVHPQDKEIAEAQTTLPVCSSFIPLRREIEKLLEKLRD